MPRRPPLDVEHTEILTKLPSGRTFRSPAIIKHTMEADYYGVGNIDSMYDGDPPQHTFRLGLSKDLVEDRFSPSGDAPVQWAELESFVVDKTRADYWAGMLVVALLHIEEYPGWVPYEAQRSWFLWLDSIDGDTALAGEIADRLVKDDEGGCPLIDGSLWFVRSLHVHPAFQGQELGVKLLVHAMWSVRRSMGDLAILFARPIPNLFAPEGPVSESKRSLQRLARYYARAGFEKIRMKDILEGVTENIPMTFHFGTFRPPVYGLGLYGLKREPEPKPPELQKT